MAAALQREYADRSAALWALFAMIKSPFAVLSFMATSLTINAKGVRQEDLIAL